MPSTLRPVPARERENVGCHTSPTYGDAVRVRLTAAPKWMPGAIGSVASVYEVTSEAYSKKAGVSVGTTMIGIEESEGTFFEVPVFLVEVID